MHSLGKRQQVISVVVQLDVYHFVWWIINMWNFNLWKGHQWWYVGRRSQKLSEKNVYSGASSSRNIRSTWIIEPSLERYQGLVSNRYSIQHSFCQSKWDLKGFKWLQMNSTSNRVKFIVFRYWKAHIKIRLHIGDSSIELKPPLCFSIWRSPFSQNVKMG